MRWSTAAGGGLPSAAAAAVEAGQFKSDALDPVASRPDALGQLGRVFQRMAQEVAAREQALKQQVQALRIEIDQSKKAHEVAQITESDYFRKLKERAELLATIAGRNRDPGNASMPMVASSTGLSNLPVQLEYRFCRGPKHGYNIGQQIRCASGSKRVSLLDIIGSFCRVQPYRLRICCPLPQRTRLMSHIHMATRQKAGVWLDFVDIHGQEHVKRALEVAAAGGHNVSMSGPPGSGKTLLACSLPRHLRCAAHTGTCSASASVTPTEAPDVTCIYSITGMLPGDVPLIRHRHFRTPHHTISQAGLVGGGQWPRSGEISLAHCHLSAKAHPP